MTPSVPFAGRRTQSRDEAFAAFVDASGARLLRTAVLLLGDRESAEDVVQTALLRTYRRWRDAQRAPVAYSRRVLINLCHDHRRHRRRHPEAPESEAMTSAVADEARYERFTERTALADALRGLPSNQREVLILRFYLELSVADTAELLGLPEGTVKSAAHRGLEAVRERLRSEHDQGVPLS